MDRELDLGAYRLLVRFTLLASVALVVLGLYRFLQGDWPWGLVFTGLGILTLVPSQYFRIRPDPAAETVLFLITKKDCSLCDEARAIIRHEIQGTVFTLQELRLEDDRRLRARFKNFVPVLIWQGEEWARLRVEPVELRRRLAAVQVRPPGSRNV